MDLQLETLDAVEAPLSADFWVGFGVGAASVLGAAAVVAGMVALT